MIHNVTVDEDKTTVEVDNSLVTLCNEKGSTHVTCGDNTLSISAAEIVLRNVGHCLMSIVLINTDKTTTHHILPDCAARIKVQVV